MSILIRKTLTELLDHLQAEAGVWVRLAADSSSGPWTLRLLELTSGVAPPNWEEMTWRYPDYLFWASAIDGPTAAKWLRAAAIPVGDLSIPTSFQPEVQGERRESGWGTNASEALLWPSQDWQLWPTGSANSPVDHELVAGGLPYFARPDIPTARLLGVPYTGFNVHGREFFWRQQDISGRLASVRIHAAEIAVTAQGDALDGALVELSSTEPGPTAEISESGAPVHLPLPNGLPDNPWIVLRRGDHWLDRRFLGWAQRDTPSGVEFVIPSESRLEALVANGEGSATEFKEQLPASEDDGHRKAMKTVAAFANGRGGTILFGVTDSGVICGLPPEEDTPKHRDRLAQLVRSWVHPLPLFRVEPLPLPDNQARHVVALTVEAGDRPPYAAGTSPDRMTFYVRRGATTFSVMPEEVRALVLRDQPSPKTYFPQPLGS